MVCQKELYVLDYTITFHMGLLGGCQKELFVLDYVITFHMGFVGGCQKELYVLDYVITFQWGLSERIICFGLYDNLSEGLSGVVRKNYMFWIIS